jgi:hypothetical protein
MKTTRGLLILLFCTQLPAFADTPINAWIKAGSGDWQDQAAWSLGVRPAPNQTIMLTNQGWKGIAIRSSTAQNFPGSLNVDSVIVSGYTDSFNVLLLNYAGTDVPLRTANGLSVADGGQVQNLYSGLIVDSGYLSVSNSDFIQVGGSVATTNATLKVDNGNYNLTNGLLQAGPVYLGLQSTGAAFVQDGGAASMTSLTIGYGLHGSGTYDLYSGWLYVGGTLLLEGPQGAAVFNQHGGTNFADSLEVSSYSGSADYNLYGGVLCANFAEVAANVSANFNQFGGDAFITNTVTIKGFNRHSDSAYVGSWLLAGGTLTAATLDLNGNDGYSVYTQSNGTARIAANILLDGHSHKGDLYLAGGTLACSNIVYSESGDSITQTGGALIVSNLFSFGGTYTPFGYPTGPLATYTFTGGALTANNMEFFGPWTIGSSAQAGRISNPGYFKLGFASLHIGDADEHLGRLILATNVIDSYAPPPVITNSFIDLDGSSSRLSFADSSAETWGPRTLLVINNWNGNPAGGGAEQLKFGTSASGLTSAQLSRIQFVIGSPPVSYPAKLLNTGELVPDTGTVTNSAINAWIKPTSGNWEESTANWSLGVLPNQSQSIYITNVGWKAVAIGANTAQNFPQSMTIKDLQITSPVDSRNVLLMNFAGFQVPLTSSSLTVGSNSSVVVQSSALETGFTSLAGTFQQGDFSQVKVHGMVQIHNSAQYASDNPPPGLYVLTNGTLSVDGGAWVGEFGKSGQFIQYGGDSYIGGILHPADEQDSCSLDIGVQGEFDLYGGQLTATNGIMVGSGDYANMSSFHQYGGNVNADMAVNGNYTLNGGNITGHMQVVMQNSYQRVDASVVQTGGTNHTTSLELGQPNRYGGRAFYTLSNGVVQADSSVSLNGGQFSQYNGQFTIASNLVVRNTEGGLDINDAHYALAGGTLSVGGGVTAQSATFNQTAGSNLIAGDLTLIGVPPPTQPGQGPQTVTYTLTGGLLSARNLIVNAGYYSGFNQTGGSAQITQKLTLQGTSPGAYCYTLAGGTLAVKDIDVADGSFFAHTNGTIVHSGLLTLRQGEWRAAAATQSLGPLQLSVGSSNNNSGISFPNGSATLRLANSSAQPWASSAILYVTNWHGSASGGGVTQLRFGSNSSGLTAPQLAQIRFNISGSLQPAKILATGEVVPGATGQVQFTRNGNNMSLSWGPGWFLQSSTNSTGPFQDVPGATSPWSVSTTKPREFFRLRQ